MHTLYIPAFLKSKLKFLQSSIPNYFLILLRNINTCGNYEISRIYALIQKSNEI